ncbi:beta family protein [Fictibacillus phosphorivorans]|uniref:beta family protein n=1 Tax=Fictibacillus phosphorivorans TaxID=1221500 RepID=UPI003CF82C8B
MFNQDHYVPILKWKRGERTALENLHSSIKEKMKPLFEIQPVSYNHAANAFSKTIDDHLQDIGDQVNSSWGQLTPVFVDLDTLYENEDFKDDILQNGQHPIEFVIEDIESKGTPAIPVTGIYRDDPFQNAIKAIIKQYNRGVCLRLEVADLADLNMLKDDLDHLLDFLEVTRDNIDIIIDYKQIIPQQEQAHTRDVTLTLVQLPYLLEWRTLTLASTAYPKNLRQIATNSYGVLPRTEWTVYQKIRGYGLARIPAFADYNITNPDYVNLDPRLINMAAGVKYTSGNEFHIFRGIGIRNNGFSQMNQICQDIISNSCYSGSHFSHGDKYIHDCATQSVTTGNAEKWVTVGVNHHLTCVIHDLSILRGPSIVGSPSS